GSMGRYIGRVPLAAKAFGAFPTRTHTFFDPTVGTVLDHYVNQPTLTDLPLPRSDAFAVEIEHRLTPSLEVQAAVRRRIGSRLPTVITPGDGGALVLEGTGESDYRELQLAVRKTWLNQSQLFLSYVRSSSEGESNDFGSLFTNLDAPLIDSNARAVTLADV